MLPKTRLGRWSVGLLVFFFFWVGVFNLLVHFLGQRGGASFFSNWKLTIPFFGMVSSGIGAFFTGVIDLFKNKSRSFLVFLSVGIGFLVLYFVIGEFLFPH